MKHRIAEWFQRRRDAEENGETWHPLTAWPWPPRSTGRNYELGIGWHLFSFRAGFEITPTSIAADIGLVYVALHSWCESG